MISTKQKLTCQCGMSNFAVRIDADEQVGLLTCQVGHHSLLLDSRDYWLDVIQERRPQETKCRCGTKKFEVALDYSFRADTEVVSSVCVTGQCCSCGTERPFANFEIDYEPTDALVSRPLDPCEDPWLKPKRVSLTALWKRDDLEQLIAHAAHQEHAMLYYAGRQEQLRRIDDAELTRLLREAQSFDLVMSNKHVTLPDVARGMWKSYPVVQVPTPIAMNYRTGKGDLYYVEYAEQVIDAGRIVEQPAEFLAFARRLVAWLNASFTAQRGKNTIDNPAEFERLKGGW